jgi:hypothetical protein
MANQINNLLLLPDDGVTRTIDTAAPDLIQVGVDWEWISGANVVIAGNLTVKGTTFTTESETVLIGDNHLYLNDGYTVAAAQTGGLVINYLPTATVDAVAATGFVAGVGAVSNPTVATVGAATFAVGDFIQISGANKVQNDGLFEVLSHAANVLTIRGIGTVGCQEDFTQNQFTTDTTVAGAITKINVSVIRAGTDGIWEVGQGSASPAGTPLVFVNLLTGTSVTLQVAYEGGNTINAVVGDGDIAFTMTSADFTVNGANDVLFGNTTPLSSFTVDAGVLSLDGTDTTNLIMTANAAGAKTLTISAINNGAGTGLLDINADDAITVDSSAAGIALNGVTASNFTVTGVSQDLTLSSVGGSVIVDGSEAAADAVHIHASNAAGGVEVVAGTGGVAVDTTGPLSLDGTGTAANLTLTANNAGASTLLIQSTNAGAGAGNLDINVDDAITMDSDSFSIDGTALSNVSVTSSGAGEDLLIQLLGATDSSLLLSSAGTGGDAISLTATAGGIDIKGKDNDAAAIEIDAGGLDYITIDSTDGAEQIILHQKVNILSGIGRDFLVGTAGVSVGSVVTIEAGLSERVIGADANSATETQRLVVGISAEAVAATGTAFIYTYHGSTVPVLFGAAPAVADNGKRVYLSTTPGIATLTAPVGTGLNVQEIGVLVGGTGAANPANVLYQPQFIARRP